MEFEYYGSEDFGRVIAAMNKILYSEKGNQAARDPEYILINARLTAGILRAALAKDTTGSLAQELQGVGRVIVNDEEFSRASGDRQQMVPFAVTIHGNNDQYEFTANGFMRGIGAAMFAREGLPVTFDRTADAFVLTRPRGIMGRALALAERWTGRTEQAEEIIRLVNRVSNQVQGKIYDEKDLLPEVEPAPGIRARPRQGFEVEGPAGRPGFGREIGPAQRRFDGGLQPLDPARVIDARPDRAALPAASRLRPDLPVQEQRHYEAVLGWMAGRSNTRGHWEYANTEGSGRNFRLYTDTSGARAERQSAYLTSLGISNRSTENDRTFLMVSEDASREFSHIDAAFAANFPNVTEEALDIFREHGIRTRHFAGLGRVVDDRERGGVIILTEEHFGRHYMGHAGLINFNRDDPLPPVLASFQGTLPRSVRAEVVGGMSGTALHIPGLTLQQAEILVEHYQEEQQAREVASALNSMPEGGTRVINLAALPPGSGRGEEATPPVPSSILEDVSLLAYMSWPVDADTRSVGRIDTRVSDLERLGISFQTAIEALNQADPAMNAREYTSSFPVAGTVVIRCEGQPFLALTGMNAEAFHRNPPVTIGEGPAGARGSGVADVVVAGNAYPDTPITSRRHAAVAGEAPPVPISAAGDVSVRLPGGLTVLSTDGVVTGRGPDHTRTGTVRDVFPDVEGAHHLDLRAILDLAREAGAPADAVLRAGDGVAFSFRNGRASVQSGSVNWTINNEPAGRGTYLDVVQQPQVRAHVEGIRRS